MSGSDSIVFNNLERLLSLDLNDVASIQSRTLMDLLGDYFTTKEYASGASFPAEARRGLVLSGLIASPSGANISISPGSLLQDSATITPVPGTLDSRYRFARLQTATVVNLASPVGDTYYLVEAQLQQNTTLTQSRDIKNPSTQNFVPTSVAKRKENQITFQILTGTSTNFPVPTGGDWIPIAGVFRPAGGGSVLAAHLYDMRPQARSRPIYQVSADAVVDKRSMMLLPHATAGYTDKLHGLRFSGVINGEHVYFNPPDPTYSIALDHASVSDPTNLPSAAAAGTWGYLYLVPWSVLKILPSGQRVRFNDGTTNYDVGGGFSRGVLVFSTVAPTLQGTIINGAALSLPAPFNGFAAPAGSAICVGAFKRPASGSGYIPCTVSGTRFRSAAMSTILNDEPITTDTDINLFAYPVNTFPKIATALYMDLSVPFVISGTLRSLVIIMQGSHAVGSMSVEESVGAEKSDILLDVVNYSTNFGLQFIADSVDSVLDIRASGYESS